MTLLKKTNKFYLVEEELYNKIVQQPQDAPAFFNDLKPKDRKKCTALLDFLTENGVKYNMIGISTEVIPEVKVNFNIIDYIIYSIQGKGPKPVLFDNFVEYLKRIRAPHDILATKIVKLFHEKHNATKKKRKTSSE